MLLIHLFEALLFVACFLLGSIPWGVIISRVFYRRDIRESGSGNIGSTNALRTLGKRGGAAVFLLDFGKGLLAGALGLAVANWLQGALFDGVPGALAVGYSMHLSGDEAILAGAATIQRTCTVAAFMAATLGHIFTPWLKFKGGKASPLRWGPCSSPSAPRQRWWKSPFSPLWWPLPATFPPGRWQPPAAAHSLRSSCSGGTRCP